MNVVFVTEEGEFVAELNDVLYAPDVMYNLFDPSA